MWEAYVGGLCGLIQLLWGAHVGDLLVGEVSPRRVVVFAPTGVSAIPGHYQNIFVINQETEAHQESHPPSSVKSAFGQRSRTQYVRKHQQLTRRHGVLFPRGL